MDSRRQNDLADRCRRDSWTLHGEAMSEPTLSEVMREEADNLPYDELDRILEAILPCVFSFFAGMCTTGLILVISLKGFL